MSYLVKSVASAVVLGSLAACDRSGFESAPVALETEFGSVSCQLYTLERIQWDHAISFPDGMTKESADALCQAEGARLFEVHKAAKQTQKAERAKSGGIFGLLSVFKPKADGEIEDAEI